MIKICQKIIKSYSKKASPKRWDNTYEFQVLQFISFLIKITGKPLDHAICNDGKTLCWFGYLITGISVTSGKKLYAGILPSANKQLLKLPGICLNK